MEPTNVKFYQLANGGDLIFERDLDGLSEHIGRPHPEFHGVEVNDQHGGELQWVITADLRGKVEPPTSRGSSFPSGRAAGWTDSLVLFRRHLRVYSLVALTQHGEAIRMLNKDRKSLRLQHAKKDATIVRLRAKIAALEITVKAHEDQLREIEDDDGGIDLQGGGAFLSDDDDFEEDEDPEEVDYEFLEAAEDGIIPIDVDVDVEE
ncbi:hypothetical protein QYE76_053303 [Lolium multiflorum]|uniref:Uncharacterized protein n=1 Tax=Lolium multiflorum TaxID=4521 RepID=A0AAD8SWM7_LOLMU|nr:hypothetical protein QYE76_053303 [Lolium multiflorum]